jgi:hypothetical protein
MTLRRALRWIKSRIIPPEAKPLILMLGWYESEVSAWIADPVHHRVSTADQSDHATS